MKKNKFVVSDKKKDKFVVETVPSDIPNFFDVTVSCGKIKHKMCMVPADLLGKMTRDLHSQVKNDLIKLSVKLKKAPQK